MLKIRKILLNCWNPIYRINHHQLYSVFQKGQRYFDPALFGALMRDLNEKDLYGQISTILNKPYLTTLQQDQNQYQKIRTGIVLGNTGQGLISLPTRTDQISAIWVHYLIDPAAPHSFLTKSALMALNLNLKARETQNTFTVFINSNKCTFKLWNLQNHSINLLGKDFMINKKELIFNLRRKQIKLVDSDQQ